MKIRKILFVLVSMLGLLFVVACGALPNPGGEPEPTPIPPVVADVEIVSEGFIVPRESVELSFFSSGQVEEVLVEEGDLVNKGDVVARLGNREEIESGIANAEAELLAANQALDKLNDDWEISKADAALEIAAANRAVRDAQYQLDNFTVPTTQSGRTAIEGLSKTKADLDAAREAFEPFKYESSSNPTRERLKEDMDDAQSEYNTAVKRLEYETQLNEAQASLDKAVQDAQDLEEGPDADAVASAEARISAAEAALESAQAALDHLELEATISGTVVDENLIIGQQVTPGQPVVTIADFSEMYAETDDLTELEVVDISLGQKAVVEPDAIPGLELEGTVDKIADIFVEKRGDITYTVRIKLDEVDPRLRWGMTVAITFIE
jgi:multidrug efflux pump subunit AcrA (membrane-fusion protein)